MGSAGDITYSQTPCQPEQETSKVLNIASQTRSHGDCRIANNFALKTAMDMRRGMSSGDVFASYGGIDAVPNTAIGVINYVYTHKENKGTVPSRIAALSAARCSGGSYGPVSCDDFPYGFVADNGGCESAATSQGFKHQNKESASNQVGNIEGTAPVLGVKSASQNIAPSAPQDACKNSIQAQMDELFQAMREGQSASSQNRLSQERKHLKSQLAEC